MPKSKPERKPERKEDKPRSEKRPEDLPVKDDKAADVKGGRRRFHG